MVDYHRDSPLGICHWKRGAIFNDQQRCSRILQRKNPQLQTLETLENTYTKDENVLFVIAPKDGNVFTRETLVEVGALTQVGWHNKSNVRFWPKADMSINDPKRTFIILTN